MRRPPRIVASPKLAAEAAQRLGAGLGRHRLDGRLEALHHRLGEPAHAGQAARGAPTSASRSSTSAGRQLAVAADAEHARRAPAPAVARAAPPRPASARRRAGSPGPGSSPWARASPPTSTSTIRSQPRPAAAAPSPRAIVARAARSRPRARSPRRGTRPCAPRRSARRSRARASPAPPASTPGASARAPSISVAARGPGSGSIGRRSQVTPPTTGCGAGVEPAGLGRGERADHVAAAADADARAGGARSTSRALGVHQPVTRAIDSAYGGSSTPASVKIARTSSAGVTSKARLSASARRGARAQHLGGVALLDRDRRAGRRSPGRASTPGRPRRRGSRGGAASTASG